jgi:GTP cyclohydrolase I
VTLNMPADILRELTRDDASARTTHPAPDMDIPAAIPFRSLCQHQMLAFYGVAHSGASGNTRTLAKLRAKQIPSGVYRRDVTVAVS